MSTEAMKLALEALESCGEGHISDGGNQWHNEKLVDKAIAALQEALAGQPAQQTAPVQEPVAWMHEWEDGEKIPMLNGRDDRIQDKPKTVRPLVYGDTPPQPAQHKQVDIAALVEGMEVSIDVSTGDHDSGNRLFGSVTLVQENQGSKHGLILLVQDPEANFKTAAPQPAPVQQEPVAGLLVGQDSDGRYVSIAAKAHADTLPLGEYKLFTSPQPAQQEPIYQYQMANGSWIDQTKESHDYNVRHGQATVRVVYASPQAQRTWVGLTESEKSKALYDKDGMTLDYEDYAYAIEAKLMEKNA